MPDCATLFHACKVWKHAGLTTIAPDAGQHGAEWARSHEHFAQHSHAQHRTEWHPSIQVRHPGWTAWQLRVPYAWPHALQCGACPLRGAQGRALHVAAGSTTVYTHTAVSGCTLFHVAGSPVTSASPTPQRRARPEGCRAALCPAPHLCTGQAQCRGRGPLCVSGEGWPEESQSAALLTGPHHQPWATMEPVRGAWGASAPQQRQGRALSIHTATMLPCVSWLIHYRLG